MTARAFADEPLPWHREPWETLLRAERDGRLPHALLLRGPAGLGKRPFARRLVAALLCTARGESQAPCGGCQGCRLLAAGNHPALSLIAPESEGRAIRIDAIREYTAGAALTAQGGGYKIAVIDPADAMNRAAANSLLKTLEEPVPGTLILLITSHSHRLPATIKSRCQSLDFRRPDRGPALEWLAPRVGGLDPALLLDLAGGAPLRAVELAAPGTLDERLKRLSELEGLAAGRQDPVALAAAWSQGELPRLLEWLWGWAADMIRLRSGAGAGALTNPDQAERLQKLANNIESKELYRILDKINETIRGLGTQLNLQMALEALLLGWAASPEARSSNQ